MDPETLLTWIGEQISKDSDFPNGIPVTKENSDAALYNERYPYGHGYVIAAHLAGLY